MASGSCGHDRRTRRCLVLHFAVSFVCPGDQWSVDRKSYGTRPVSADIRSIRCGRTRLWLRAGLPIHTDTVRRRKLLLTAFLHAAPQNWALGRYVARYRRNWLPVRCCLALGLGPQARGHCRPPFSRSKLIGRCGQKHGREGAWANTSCLCSTTKPTVGGDPCGGQRNPHADRIERPATRVLHSLQENDRPLDPERSEAGEPLWFEFPLRVAPGPKFFGKQVRREGPMRRFVYVRVGGADGGRLRVHLVTPHEDQHSRHR